MSRYVRIRFQTEFSLGALEIMLRNNAPRRSTLLQVGRCFLSDFASRLVADATSRFKAPALAYGRLKLRYLFQARPLDTFATIQSVAGRINKLPDFGLVLVDEAHHIGAASFRQALGLLSPPMVAGVTTTPWRGDGYDIDTILGAALMKVNQ